MSRTSLIVERTIEAGQSITSIKAPKAPPKPVLFFSGLANLVIGVPPITGAVLVLCLTFPVKAVSGKGLKTLELTGLKALGVAPPLMMSTILERSVSLAMTSLDLLD